MIKIYAKKGIRTAIGRLGENEARVVAFPVKDIQDSFPGASFTMLNRRPCDTQAYPVNGQYVSVEGGELLWTVQSGDLAYEGYGECEIRAELGGAVVKTVIYQTDILRALDGAGTPPEPWESWVEDVTDAADRAEAAAALLENPGAEAETLTAGSSATASYSNGTFYFGIPRGQKGNPGNPGDPGQPGQDGVSPTVAVEAITGGHQVTITDAEGDHTFDVMDGEQGDPGSPGQPGQDGYSPSASVTKSGSTATISITDKNGTTTAQVSDGDPSTIIDDQAGSGDTGKVWSADKSAGLLSAINTITPTEYSASSTYAVGDLCWHENKMYRCNTAISTAEAWTAAHWTEIAFPRDVRVNGTSVVDADGIAKVLLASQDDFGVMKIHPYFGTAINNNGVLYLYKASDTDLKGSSSDCRPITPSIQDKSVFYGLAKLASADMASLSGVTVGQYPEAQKVAIQKMLGIYEAPWELIREDTVTNATEADIEITVDGNGNAFELTDVYMQVWTPQQETESIIGDYGKVMSYYNDNNVIASQMGQWTQAANASARYGQVLLTNENGAVKNITTQNTTQYGLVGMTTRTNIIGDDALMKIGTFTFKKIVIKKVTGTAKYKLYGKRKWTV